jgi:hypothetical protein
MCNFVPKSDFGGLPSSRLLATLAVKWFKKKKKKKKSTKLLYFDNANRLLLRNKL